MFLRIFFAILFLFSCSSVFAKYEQNVVIANINNKVITFSDLQDRYHFLTTIAKIPVKTNQEKLMIYNQIIDKMIDEELIRQEGARLGMSVDESELSGIIESLAARQKKSVAIFKNNFISNDISFENYQKQLRADLLWSKIVATSLKSKIKITDLEIKEFFEQQKLETDITKYFIAEIFIPKGDDAKMLALKLSEELKNGANFNDIVKQFSRSASLENNGEIGWVSKGDIDKKIYDAIHFLPKNSYSDAIFLTDGYYIFKLLDKKSVTEIKEDDINFAKNRIFMKELEREGKGYLMDIRKRSFIEVYRDKIRYN